MRTDLTPLEHELMLLVAERSNNGTKWVKWHPNTAHEEPRKTIEALIEKGLVRTKYRRNKTAVRIKIAPEGLMLARIYGAL